MSSVTTMPAQTARGWSIETFKRFWAKPRLEYVRAVDGVVTEDVVGYWPRPIGIVRGADPYLGVIEDLLRAIPDFSLQAPDYAVSGDLTFVRWIAGGTAPDGTRFQANGCDRVRVRAGQVCENYIFSDHPFFTWVVSARSRPASCQS
jgi:ketosteroid isomerase-like protein